MGRHSLILLVLAKKSSQVYPTVVPMVLMTCGMSQFFDIFSTLIPDLKWTSADFRSGYLPAIHDPFEGLHFRSGGSMNPQHE